MSYIVFVQPTVLAMAGMNFGSVLLATCLLGIGMPAHGFPGQLPCCARAGHGRELPVHVYGLHGYGFSWQSGLTIVLFSGLLFTALSLFSFREKIMDVFPPCLKNAIGPAIGLFIAFVGLQWSGIVVLNSATMVALGNLRHAAPLIAIAGFFLIAVLMAYKVNGGILIGILFTTGLGLSFGVIPRTMPEFTWSTETFFNLGIQELLVRWQDALLAILLFFFLDLFDTVGTLVGVSTQAGLMTEDGKLPRAGRAFLPMRWVPASAPCAAPRPSPVILKAPPGLPPGAHRLRRHRYRAVFFQRHSFRAGGRPGRHQCGTRLLPGAGH